MKTSGRRTKEHLQLNKCQSKELDNYSWQRMLITNDVTYLAQAEKSADRHITSATHIAQLKPMKEISYN